MKNVKNLKNVKKIKKVLVIALVVAVVSAMTLVVASADPGTNMSSIQGTLTTSFQTVVNDLLGMVGAILPIGLTVLGVTMAIAFSIRWFRNITRQTGS